MKLIRVLVAAAASLALILPLGAVADASSKRLPQREIVNARLDKVHGKEVYTLKVRNYSHKRVIMQRKICKACPYRTYVVKRTNTNGVAKFVLPYPKAKGKLWWRPYLPATPAYRATVGPTAVTCLNVTCTV